MKLHLFTTTEPETYTGIYDDSNKHLRYYDYKHLANVKFVEDTINYSDVIGLLGCIIAVCGIIAVLFLA